MVQETQLESEKAKDTKKVPDKVDDSEQKDKVSDGREKSDQAPVTGEKASALLAQEAWVSDKSKPFAAPQDRKPAENLEQWRKLVNQVSAGAGSAIRSLEQFLPFINKSIEELNAIQDSKQGTIDSARFARVLSTVEDFDKNQKALSQAQVENNKAQIDLLSKEQEALKQRMESKEFRNELEAASKDLSSAFNNFRAILTPTFNSALQGVVKEGRPFPTERLPIDVPRGINGLAVSDAEFRSMIERGEIKLPEKQLAEGELPRGSDLLQLEKTLTANNELLRVLNRVALEQEYEKNKIKLSMIDRSGKLAQSWFPDEARDMSDQQLERKLALAKPWIKKGFEVQLIAEQHHRLDKMLKDQFNWPKWLGGMPSKWDSSAIENHKDLVSIERNSKGGFSTIVALPDTLEQTDENQTQIRRLDEWLTKYRPAVDQVMKQIEGSSAENAIIFYGDTKSEMKVDRDGVTVESGFRDANGKQVFQESDGRKYRFDENNKKQWLAPEEKVNAADFKIINGKTVWVQPGEKIEHVNLLEFRPSAKEVIENGEKFIEITQTSKLQYATWASYQGWGLVNDIKVMGGDVKAAPLKEAMTLPTDQAVAGMRREGKPGDLLLTLADGRKQFMDKESFDKQYREKEGKPGEFEERPRRHKPDDWLIVYKTDSGSPQPTLMQAKEVPAFIESQRRWHIGGKAIITGVDFVMLISGAAELRAAAAGIQATAGGAAKMALGQALGKALLTQQGLTGALHLGFGVTGFAGQSIENLGPAGHAFMQARAIAMVADLGYTAIGRPGTVAGFVPSAEQLKSAGFMTRSLMAYNQAFSATPIARLVGAEKAPIGFLKTVSAGQVQALAADVYFLGEMGIRQVPGIWNRAHGTDSQYVQQRQALERHVPGSTVAEDRKIPSSFDKQAMLKIEAFKGDTEAALNMKAEDPARIALNKKWIEIVKNEKADRRDRLGAAFALVSVNAKDGPLPEKLSADEASIARNELQKFIDSQRYLQAEGVLTGYADGLSHHASNEVKARLSELVLRSKNAMSDDPAQRNAAISHLLGRFKDKATSPEEKLVVASALLMTRRHENSDQLSETIKAGTESLKASELVDYLHRSSMAKMSPDDATNNPGHTRLFAGDMMMRLDIDRFSIVDMNQIVLSIVNDNNAPSDPAAKERWLQLKMQAMADSHGSRLGDLHEQMKSRVEPQIAMMPTNTRAEVEAKQLAMGSLVGRDSEAMKSALEKLRSNPDKRIANLASYMLYAASANSQQERTKAFEALHESQNPLFRNESADPTEQNNWSKKYESFLQERIAAELPSSAGTAFDIASSEKMRAVDELIARGINPRTNPDLSGKVNAALLSLISANNPTIAARAHSALLNQLQVQNREFADLKAESLTQAQKDLREQSIGEGGVLDALKEASIDLLQDSAAFSSFTSRAENLEKDLRNLTQEYARNAANLSENERAVLQNKIQEILTARKNAGSGPVELKQALIKNLPGLAAIDASFASVDAVQQTGKKTVESLLKLAELSNENPETFSPKLRAESIKALAGQSILQTDREKDLRESVAVKLSQALKHDPSPLVRLAALESMAKLGAANLGKTCFEQLKTEQHPEVAKRLREIEFASRVMDENAKDYIEKYQQARSELVHSSMRSLSGADAFIKGDPALSVLDGQTLKEKVFADLKDKFFDGFGGFVNFAWHGESGVTADNGRLLEKYGREMRTQMESLGQRAQNEPEALKALVYIALSNGRPLLKDDRNWAVEKATEKLRDLCRQANPEQAKNLVWATEMLMLNQPMMNATGRQNILDGMKVLLAKTGQSGMSDAHVSTLLTVALQHEMRNTPSKDRADYKQHEKLQLDLLEMLSTSRLQKKESLPVLAAISADGKQPKGSSEVIPSVQAKARELFNLIAKDEQRIENFSKHIDYQDAYERVLKQIRENATRKHNLDQYTGPDNWFSKNQNYSLLDVDKLREAQRKAAEDAFPGFIPWIFTSRATIDKNVDAAVEQVWRTKDRQLQNLGNQSKESDQSGKEAREALASIILTQGQPFPEETRVWAMREAAGYLRNNFRDGHTGSTEMLWAVQTALIEGANIDRHTRFELMSALDYAKQRGAIDQKEASITMAAALETEMKSMPQKQNDVKAYLTSLQNQQYAMDLIAIWGNQEASPVLKALEKHHPEPIMRQRAKETLELLEYKAALRAQAAQGEIIGVQRMRGGSALPTLSIK